MMRNSSVPVNVKGSPSEISSFARALGSEKKYLEMVKEYGLNDPRILKNKYKLEKATKEFERNTGLLWPFK